MRGNGEGQRVVAVEERKEVGHGDIVSSHEYFSSRDRTASRLQASLFPTSIMRQRITAHQYA